MKNENHSVGITENQTCAFLLVSLKWWTSKLTGQGDSIHDDIILSIRLL